MRGGRIRGQGTYGCVYYPAVKCYIGDVDKDIRICVHPDFQNKGYGTESIKEFHKLFPNSLAKIKIDNKQSLKSFENAGYKITYFLLTKENDTDN